MNYQILVDRKHGLDKDYVPKNLVDVQSTYKDGIKLEAVTYEHWLKLKERVANEGFIIEAESGYRSYDYQTKILNELITEKGSDYAYKAVALPGHSEHQTGLAIDYSVVKDGQFLIEGDLYNDDVCHFTNSIAHHYGFIVRYPKDKDAITGYKYEPWHLRYVGEALATYLYNTKLTLDEYYMEANNEKD